MDINQKIRTVMLMQDINITELAKRLGTSQQNLSKRLKIGKFSLQEYESIAKVLGVDFHLFFELPDGTRIE